MITNPHYPMNALINPVKAAISTFLGELEKFT
jgi:hypothetical protein